MSRPLACGDLWAKLESVHERLTVVVSAGSLRRQDIRIDSRLSWEQCAEHALAAQDCFHTPGGQVYELVGEDDVATRQDDSDNDHPPRHKKRVRLLSLLRITHYESTLITN